MSTNPIPSPSRSSVLDGIDWDTYKRLLRAFQGRRRFRLTYDRGRLEIMSPLWEHERPASILGRFVEFLTLAAGRPLLARRSVTLRRRRFLRGVEPDNSYWIDSTPRLQGRTRLDLRVDPPPDLAVEVDVTSSSIPRMPIYARLGVPEVWRVDAQGLTFHVLEAGQDPIRTNSLAFPALRSADLMPFLALIGQTDDNTIFRQFETWARQALLGSGGSSAATP